MQAIAHRLAEIKVGTETTFRNLTMFPLLNGGIEQPDYLILDEALAQGRAHIAEVSEGGSVPELKLVNESDRPIFLLDGEELVGAKQNRILNLSILAPAMQTLIIPVSCVEQGRWNYSTTEFATAQRAHYAAGRAMKMSQVTRSLSTTGQQYSDQSAVWADIAAKTSRLGSSSHTQSMAGIYERHQTNIEDYVSAFSDCEGQVGALFAINGKVIGFDLFDCAATLQKLLPKLVRSCALDALDRQEDNPATALDSDAKELLQTAAKTQAKTFAAIGMGEDVRLTDKCITGGGLMASDRLIHLSAFYLKEEQNLTTGYETFSYNTTIQQQPNQQTPIQQSFRE